jgi:hypothetical protein
MSADDLAGVPGTHLIEAAWSVLRCPDPDGTDPSREEARAEFSRWLSTRDAEVARRAIVGLTDAIERETADADKVNVRHLIGRLRSAAETPKEAELGNVVPLRDERCDEKHEEPLRQTSRTAISNRVHFCTKNRYHGGGHRDSVSGKEWG